MCPVNTSDSFISFSVIPVLFIKLPAKMNSGIANNVKDCVDVTTFEQLLKKVFPSYKEKVTPATPMERPQTYQGPVKLKNY